MSVPYPCGALRVPCQPGRSLTSCHVADTPRHAIVRRRRKHRESPDVATSQEAATASSNSGRPQTRLPPRPVSPAAEAGAEAPAAEVAPEDQPRTRRARAVADDQATLAQKRRHNDAETLRSQDAQITTINFSCSSVTTL